jgi:hypothetical protein
MSLLVKLTNHFEEVPDRDHTVETNKIYNSISFIDLIFFKIIDRIISLIFILTFEIFCG